jgi:hypothetical protein
MIGERFNYDDTFFRDLTTCVLATLENKIKWINRFSDKAVKVDVPFYYSMTGDERFLLDSFTDDIVSDSRKNELNTDIIPRGHVTLKNFNIISDEFKNPNVWLRTVVENQEEIRKVLTKVRALPIKVNYELVILLESEIDTFKCSQAIMDTLWVYKYMYFEHNFMRIDAVMEVPDSSDIEITREKNMTSDNTIKLTVNLEVNTYYPAYRKDLVQLRGQARDYGDGMTDHNSHVLNGGISDYFTDPFDYIGGRDNINTGDVEYGEPDNFNSDDSQVTYGETQNDPSHYSTPKRTRWYDNILRARENNRTIINNPNASLFDKNKKK